MMISPEGPPVSGGQRRTGRTSLRGTGLLLAALAAPAVLSCSSDPAIGTEDSLQEPAVPQQILVGVHLRETSVRGLLWVLEADHGVSYGPQDPIHLETLTVRFYDGGPMVKSTLTSRRGVVDEKSRTITALDSVVVVTPDGERLETEQLHWDPVNEQVTNDTFFRLTRGGDLLTGVGIRAEPDLSRYEILGEVRAEMVDQDNREILEALDGETPAAP